MSKETKYGIKSLKHDFPNEEACLQFLFDSQHTRKCSCGGTYRLIDGRRQFQCSRCRFQIAPMARTLFQKSTTPLTLWFHAIWIFSNAKSGISAMEMQRHLEVTYKTAWRILSLIRKALKQDDDKLKGDVEMDGAYFGGRHYGGKNNEKLGDITTATATKIGLLLCSKLYCAFKSVDEVVAVDEGVYVHKSSISNVPLKHNPKTEENRLYGSLL